MNRQRGYTEQEYFGAYIAQLVRSIVEQYQIPVQIIVDIGSGSGLIAYYLHGFFSTATLQGVDIDADAIANAREQYPELLWHLVQGSTLPFDSASIDFLYAVNVLHHIPFSALPEHLAVYMRVIRPGGYALFVEPNPYNVRARRQFREEHSEHMTMLRPTVLRSWLQQYGCVTTRYYALPIWARFRCIEQVLNRIALGRLYAVVVQRMS